MSLLDAKELGTVCRNVKRSGKSAYLMVAPEVTPSRVEAMADHVVAEGLTAAWDKPPSTEGILIVQAPAFDDLLWDAEGKQVVGGQFSLKETLQRRPRIVQ